MSYGRDTSMLPRAGSFRQMGTAAKQKPKTKGSGGGGGGGFLRWRDVYKPSMLGADVIRLLRGDYVNYYVPMDEEGNVLHFEADGSPQVFQSTEQFIRFTEHRSSRTKKTCICSGGPRRQFKDYADPCLGCFDYHAGWKKLRDEYKGDDGKGKVPAGKRPSMGRSDQWAMSALHYANYHNQPQRDDKGNIKKNPNTGDPYMEWKPCQATYNYPCQSCKDGCETRLGHVGHWPMGLGHWNVMLSLDARVGDSCANCGGEPIEQMPGQRIACVQSGGHWLCPNCDESVIDLASTSLKPEEIVKMTTSIITCPNCNQSGFLVEYLECRNRCGQPRRATLFDVDIWVMRVKQGEGDSETTVLQPTGFSAPRPIDPNFQSIAKPLDLPKIYEPTSLDSQARDFQLPLPAEWVAGTAQPAAQAPVTASEAARPYATPAPQMQGGPSVVIPAGAGMYKP